MRGLKKFISCLLVFAIMMSVCDGFKVPVFAASNSLSVNAAVTPTATPKANVTVTATPAPTATATPQPTATPAATPKPTATPTPTPTPVSTARTALDYTIFSANAGTDFQLSCWKSFITGDVYTGKSFVFSGSELYLTGRADAVKAVTTSGWIMNITNRNPNSPSIAMPNLEASILQKAAGYKTYKGSTTFSQSNIFLNQSIKVDNAVSFNGSSFTGNCYVIAGGNISYNVDTLNYKSTNKLVLYSQNGDITISGNNITLNGIIYAPHGKVTFNVNTLTLNGRVIADKVIFSGSQFNVKGSADDLSLISDTGVQKTYTTTADFAAGTFNGLSTNKADELTLSDKTTTVPVKTEATFGDTTTAQGIKIVRSTDKDILTPTTDSLALQYDLSGFGDATTKDNGVDLVIALDLSLSMEWYGYIGPAKAAAREVISQMKANDRCAIVGFTSEAKTFLNFTSDKALLTATIDSLELNYFTAINSGIDESLRILAEQSTSNKQQYIILLSDGESNDGPWGSSQSAAVAGSRGIRIFSLMIGTGTFEMQKIAINSNGIYRNSPTPDQISAIMATFADEVFNTAGRNAAFTTTIKDASTVDLTAVSPAPTTVVNNSDGSVTLAWSYDKITVSEAKTISIPLTLKGLSDAGIVDISKNTSCVYYNRDGLPTIIYLDDFSMPVSRYVSQGTWSAVFDSTKANTEWSSIYWNAKVYDGTDITITASTSSDGVTFGTPVTVTNYGSLSGVSGRYIKLQAAMNVSVTGKSPELFDITVLSKGIATPAHVNQTPVVKIVSGGATKVGVPLSIRADISDDSNAGLTQITWSSDSGAVHFTSTNRVMTTVTADAVGTYTVKCTFTDGVNTAVDSMIITVAKADSYGQIDPETGSTASAPKIAVTLPATSEINQVISSKIENVNNAQISWYSVIVNDSVVCPVADDGTFSITMPGNAAVVAVSVRAFDWSGNSDHKDFTITVKDMRPTVQITASKASVTVGDPSPSFVVAWTNTDRLAAAKYTLNGTAVTLTNGQYDLSTSVAGTYVLSVTAASTMGDTITATATITVVVPDTTPPVLTASMASTAVYVGDPVGINIDASDDRGVVTVSVEADSGSVQNTNGTYIYTASEKGTHTITVTAVDGAGNKTTVTLSVKAFDKTTDPTSPKVSFSGITDGQVITAPTDITGTVTEAGLNYYVLEYAPVGDTNFTEFARGTKAVDNGVLGTFDPTLLNNGWYTIRICGYGPTEYSESDITVSVEGQMKIGNFSIAFEDMSVPVDNFPLTITRGYDSRSKNTAGDFGYGWSLGISSVKVSESVTPGENWSQKSSGGGSMATYSITETRPHTVSIDWGNGQIDKFNMKLTPGSQLLIPIQTGISVSYTATSGTTSTLEALGTTTDLLYNAGTLYDLDLNVYNPTEYKLTQADGTVYIISETTGVESITHPDGTVINFDKDGVHHSDGKSILFTRDTQGRITKITGPTGDTVSYTYDAAGNLTDVVDLSGSTTSFTYDTHHYLTAIKDARGVTVSRNEYDDNGRLIATVDADGNRTEFTHDIDGRQEVITDRLGHATLYIYDDRGNVLSKTDANNNTTTYSYDANNQMKSKTDALGNTTQYSYDAMGKLLSYTDAAGSVLNNTYSAKGYLTSIAALGVTQLVINYDDAGSITDTTDAAGNTTSYTYDSQSRVTGVTDAIGVYVKFTYDANGHVATAINGLGLTSTFTYDAKGNCISRSQNKTNDTGEQVVTEHYAYDAAGHLTQVIYADGTVTNTEYNAIGKISAAVDSKGRRTTYEYDLFGNLAKITYCDNTTETFAYDKEGRNTSATDRMGRTVTMTYDAVGNLLSTTYPNQSKISYTYDKVYRLKTATGTNGAVTTYEYDALGRNTAIVDALGNRTEFGYNAASLLISMTDSKGNVYHYEYDANGKRTKTILPDGSASSTVYDARGRVTSVTDQHGYTTTYAYDGLDRLTSVTDAAGKAWKYTYDETGDLTAVTDANGNTTRYAYDLMGRVIKTTNAQNASASMTYDESGNVLTATDYAGVLTTYAYDGLDRLISKTTGTSVVSFTYTLDGLLATVTDASGVTKYTYDSMNGLTDVQYPDSTYLHYVYDVSGRLTSVQTAYGTTGYTYDLLNRLTSVTDLTGAVTTYTYDANGNRTSMKYANGVTTNYTYDSCNRLIQETITDSTGIVLESYAITLGDAGERTQIVELHRTVSYEYDSLYRLTKETISAGGLSKETTYTYDAMGNRLTKTSDGAVTGYTYNSLNQITGETGITYTYDANGSQTSQDGPAKTAAYTYDQQGRLTGAVVTTGGTTTTETYQYNWSGIRTSKTTDGVKTKYLIDPNGSLSQVIAELDSAGNLVTYYTRGSELISLHRTGGTSATETRYYQYDPNGSVRLLTDGTGAITDTYTYDAFGNLLAQTGTTVNSYLYNGQQYDVNTGFYYLRARYMNPSTGTFISMDPAQGSIFDPVSLHKYLYANANPVMNCDPSGRSAGTLADAEGACAISIELDEATTGPIVEAGIRIIKTAMIMSVLLSGVAALLVVGVIDAILDSDAATSSDDLNRRIRDRILSNAMPWSVSGAIAIPLADATTDDNDKKTGPYTVYALVDLNVTINEFPFKYVEYVGRTKNVKATEARHKSNPARTSLELRKLKTNLTREAARGLEQYYIGYFKTLERGNLARNQINGVSPNNVNIDKYNNAATAVLSDESETYVGSLE